MPVSKVRRYLAAFVRAGYVRQNGKSGTYDLGPASRHLGLSAIARHDLVNAAADALSDLAHATGLTALLAVWGSRGATVVRWERAPSLIATSFGLGTTLPLLTSATGQVFLAYSPPQAIASCLSAEGPDALGSARMQAPEPDMDLAARVNILAERVRRLRWTANTCLASSQSPHRSSTGSMRRKRWPRSLAPMPQSLRPAARPLKPFSPLPRSTA